MSNSSYIEKAKAGASKTMLKERLEMHFPGQFHDMLGTSSPERKVTVMQMFAKVYGLEPSQILFVDDYFKAVDAAADAGFCAMSTQELVNRQYSAEKPVI